MTSKNSWLSPNFDENLVSIIISLYNREGLISETLDSVAHQSYRPIECIIVDDGSKDQSRIVVENYISKYSGNVSFKYYYQDNKGAQAARNFGSRKASGSYFQYLDSDDILYKDKLTLQVQAFKANTNIHGVYSDWKIGTKLKSKSVVSDMAINEDSVTNYITNGPLVNFSPLFSRNSLNSIGPWNEKLTINEELEYHIRFYCEGYKFCYVNYESGLYREHSGFRLYQNNSFKNLYYYFTHVEKLLITSGLWTSAIGIVMSNEIIFNVIQRNYKQKELRLPLLLKALEHNKDVLPFQSRKVKLISLIFGNRLALKFWILTLRYL